MANSNGWGDGSANNNIGWGQGAVNNNISWGKSQIDSWSGATDIDGGNAPVNTIAPVISGSTSLGSVLTTTNGTWTSLTAITYSYQWYRGATLITGATSSTYTIVVADSAASITCKVTATNSLGSNLATSNAITAQTFTAPVNTVAPAITGTAQEGQTLTSSTGTWTGNPTPTYSYQWKRNGSNIGSATNSSYTLVTADVGQSIKCTVTATNALGSSNADSNTVTPTSSFDADAQAFITAAAITDPTQQAAINTLVTDLKGYNIWTKFKAIYPIVGGSAATHKWNLKDPRDLDAAFRLTFATGWTHASTGMLPNGTSAFADTKLNLDTTTNLNSVAFGVYSRSNTAGGNRYHGASSATSFFTLSEKLTSNNYLASINDNGLIGTFSASTDSRGFFQGSRTAVNAIRIAKNNSQVTSSIASTTKPAFNVFIGANNNQNVANRYNDKEVAFFYISDGLISTEMTNLYTAVQAYQTTLGREMIENQILNLDAGNSLSYPGTGTVWTDISSSNGYNGTLNGGVAYSTSNGGVLVYDGVDDYVSIPLSKNALANVTGKWTIQFWVYISGSQSSVGVFQMADGTSSANPWLLLQRQNPTTIRWYVNGGYQITQTITTNTWYNLAITYDGTTVKFYTNGIEEITTYVGGTGANTAATTFLANGFSGYLNGRMPQIQAYTTNLSATQILNNYNNQKTRYI